MRDDFFAHPSYLRVRHLRARRRARAPRRPPAAASAALRRWANSPGHWAVILSTHYRWMGAARAVGRYGGARATIWVVRFGKH